MKESEWIVSPEELRKNQERALFKEEQLKENKKSKIIETLSVIAFIIVFALILLLISKMNQDTIESCINAGNTTDFCINAIG